MKTKPYHRSFIHATMMDDVSLCDELIEYYNNNSEYKERGFAYGAEKISTDVIVFPWSKNKSIAKYYKFLSQALVNYKEIYEDSPMPHCLYFGEEFHIQHYEPNEGYFNWHCERGMHQSIQRALVFMTYLNDVTDGGETEWKHYNLRLKPKKGMTVIWPTDFTHIHRGITSKTQSKTIATGWFNFIDAKGTASHYEKHINLMMRK